MSRFRDANDLQASHPVESASQADLIKEVLHAHGGERAIVGTDWPHVKMGPNGTLGDKGAVDIPAQLQLIYDCCDGDGELWVKAMRDNAARLYA